MAVTGCLAPDLKERSVQALRGVFAQTFQQEGEAGLPQLRHLASLIVAVEGLESCSPKAEQRLFKEFPPEPVVEELRTAVERGEAPPAPPSAPRAPAEPRLKWWESPATSCDRAANTAFAAEWGSLRDDFFNKDEPSRAKVMQHLQGLHKKAGKGSLEEVFITQAETGGLQYAPPDHEPVTIECVSRAALQRKAREEMSSALEDLSERVTSEDLPPLAALYLLHRRDRPPELIYSEAVLTQIGIRDAKLRKALLAQKPTKAQLLSEYLPQIGASESELRQIQLGRSLPEIREATARKKEREATGQERKAAQAAAAEQAQRRKAALEPPKTPGTAGTVQETRYYLYGLANRVAAALGYPQLGTKAYFTSVPLQLRQKLEGLRDRSSSAYRLVVSEDALAKQRKLVEEVWTHACSLLSDHLQEPVGEATLVGILPGGGIRTCSPLLSAAGKLEGARRSRKR